MCKFLYISHSGMGSTEDPHDQVFGKKDLCVLMIGVRIPVRLKFTVVDTEFCL